MRICSLRSADMVGMKIDQNDPLYIGNSDSSSVVLIPIKLIGSENYGV